MYKRHCLVFTSTKCWTTFEPEQPLSEDELFDECNIRLLYIEPGIFGELRMRPSMPPAPFKNGIFKSTTAIIEPIQTSQVEVEPLDLTVTDYQDCDSLMKQDLCAAIIQHETYHDAPLSGTLDQIHSDIELDSVLTQLINRHKPAPFTGNNNEQHEVTNLPDSKNVLSNITRDNMMDCIVKVNRLTEAELESWLKPVSHIQQAGYQLRARKKPVSNIRLARNAKVDVNYTFSSGSSQDECDDDFTVRPGKWKKNVLATFMFQ